MSELYFDNEAQGQIYDAQAEDYAEYSESSYAWQFIERPAFDKYIPDLYLPGTKVLDVGCGSGQVARHLINRGILPENIIGLDNSGELLKLAASHIPDVMFVKSAIEDFDYPTESFDLVTQNTLFHHLDNEALNQELEVIYKILRPNGVFFFVDIDPDHTPEAQDSENVDKWVMVKTPWGTEVPFFNRDPRDLMNALDLHGFDLVTGWTLKVAGEGMADWKNYLYYSTHPSRMAGRFRKVSEHAKERRQHRIPNLSDLVQARSVKMY